MAPATLYHVPRTISSPIVQMILELNNPGKVRIEEMTFQSIKSVEYTSTVNPMGTSPAYVDSDLDIIMYESGAIIDYILELYDPNHQLHPAPVDPSSTSLATVSLRAFKKDDKVLLRKRSKYLQLKQYIIATVYPMVASLYLHSLKPLLDQDPQYMEQAKSKWLNVIGPVLVKALGDSQFFMDDTENLRKTTSKGKNSYAYSSPSAIDYLIAKPLTNLNQMGLLQPFPTLKALFDRIAVRPTYKRSYTVGGAVDVGEISSSTVPPKIASGGTRSVVGDVGSDDNATGKKVGVKSVMKRIQKTIRSTLDPPGDKADARKPSTSGNEVEDEVAEGTFLLSFEDDE